MATACSCRSHTLWVFVQIVAQIHIPNERLARLPRQAARGVALTRTTTTRSLTAGLPSGVRTLRTASGPDNTTSDAVDDSVSADVPSEARHEEQKLDPYISPDEDTLFKIDTPSKATRKPRVRYAKLVRPSSATAGPATSTTEMQPRSPDSTRSSPVQDPLIQDPVFSLDEEARLVEDRKEKQRLDTKREREQSRMDRYNERQQEKAEREKQRLQDRPLWAIQKDALKKKFPEGWAPRKKLSPDALSGIRALHQQFPDMYTTETLANKFEVSPEAIRRILRAKWEPSAEEEEDRQRRWYNRGVAVWDRYAALGKKPPKKWRDAGIALRPWGGLKSWDREPRTSDRDYSGEDTVYDGEEAEVDLEKQRRLKAQRRLAKNLM